MLTRNKALQILGFTLNSKPTPTEIQINYKKLAARFHPDKNLGKDTTQEFQDIAQANELLSRPRAEQDRESARAGIEEFNDPFHFIQANFFRPKFSSQSNEFNGNSSDLTKVPPEKIYTLLVTTVAGDNKGKTKKTFTLNYSQENEQAFIKQCKRDLANIVSLRIADLQLPPSAVEIILANLLCNQTLSKVYYPLDFFNDDQVKKLNDHVEQSNRKKHSH